MGREYDQLSELAALWKSRGSDRKPVNVATTDRFCEVCIALARKQGIDFPILATIEIPDMNGVKHWLCRVHGDAALKKRAERLAKTACKNDGSD